MDKHDVSISPSIPTDILTLERAASVLDCSPRILADKIRANEIRAYKRLNRWYLLHQDLESWIKSGEANSSSSAKRKK